MFLQITDVLNCGDLSMLILGLCGPIMTRTFAQIYRRLKGQMSIYINSMIYIMCKPSLLSSGPQHLHCIFESVSTRIVVEFFFAYLHDLRTLLHSVAITIRCLKTGNLNIRHFFYSRELISICGNVPHFMKSIASLQYAIEQGISKPQVERMFFLLDINYKHLNIQPLQISAIYD